MCSQTVASACPRDMKRVESARNALQCVHRVSACSHTPMTATRTHTIPPPRTNTGIATLCVFETCGGGVGRGGALLANASTIDACLCITIDARMHGPSESAHSHSTHLDGDGVGLAKHGLAKLVQLLVESRSLGQITGLACRIHHSSSDITPWITTWAHHIRQRHV